MKFNQSKTAGMIDDAFRKGKALDRAITSVRRRVRYSENPKQVEYAHAVLGILADGHGRPVHRGPTIGLIQAETGTGKTLGYTVPLLLYSAMTGKRVAISTYTLQLIHQLNETELPVAVKVVHELTGKKLYFARRLGMQNFLSTKRIVSLLADQAFRHVHKKLKSMIEFAASPKSDGLIAEWIEEHGELPEGVTAGMVCITSDVAEQEAKYQEHVLASKEADVLITTHASSILHMLTWFQTLDDADNRTSVIVFDEADRLPAAAESVIHSKVQIGRCLHLIRRTAENSRANLDGARKEVEKIKDWFDGMGERYFVNDSPGERRFVPFGRCAPADQAMSAKNANRLRAALRLARRATKANDPLRLEIEQEIGGLDEYLKVVKKQVKNHDDLSAPVMSWSPHNRYAGFETIPLFPGRIIGRCWAKSKDRRKWKDADLEAVIFTSAALSADAWSGVAADRLYSDIRSEIGIYTSADADKALRVMKVRPFIQARFGSVEFVLADPRTPSPTRHPKPDKGKRKSSETIFEEMQPGGSTDPAWLDYAGRMARAAVKDGRTLVLCTSYADTKAIGESTPNARVHEPGESLDTVKNDFLKGDYSALVTPAGWEGLDLKGAIKNVVITRLPFEPPDRLRQELVVKFLMEKNYSEEKATGVVLRLQRSKAARKFLQALGRLIRDKHDSGTIWISDPRFPLPESWEDDPRLVGEWRRPWHLFVDVIPARFREGEDSAYNRARVFVFENGRSRMIETQVFAEEVA